MEKGKWYLIKLGSCVALVEFSLIRDKVLRATCYHAQGAVSSWEGAKKSGDYFCVGWELIKETTEDEGLKELKMQYVLHFML